MDWFLNKTRLVGLEKEEISEDQEPEYIDKTWLEIIPWRKDKESEKKRSVFFKNILTYDDGKAVIENYKRGAVCIFLFNLRSREIIPRFWYKSLAIIFVSP